MGQMFGDMGQTAVKTSERWEWALARDFKKQNFWHTERDREKEIPDIETGIQEVPEHERQYPI